jgi:hypothetical protein
MIRALLFALVALLCSVATQAQTQASCTFTFFPLTLNLPNVGTGNLSPNGINDFGTVVGLADFQNGSEAGFIRWANGGITFPMGTSSQSSLADRNDGGLSIGSSFPNQILLNGTTVTPIELNVTNFGFFANGVNKWNSIVGTYLDSKSNIHGFKRWSNSGAISLDFPGASQTRPARINDGGAIVGLYDDPGGQAHGFIYHNGEWATLDYPNTPETALTGISDAGVIIGNGVDIGEIPTAFAYDKGVFKVISVPNSPTHSTIVTGISPKLGLIVGVNLSPAGQGFIATCH